MASAWVRGSETIHRSAASCSRDSRPSQPTRPATARMTTATRHRAIFILSAHQAKQTVKQRREIVSGQANTTFGNFCLGERARLHHSYRSEPPIGTVLTLTGDRVAS